MAGDRCRVTVLHREAPEMQAAAKERSCFVPCGFGIAEARGGDGSGTGRRIGIERREALKKRGGARGFNRILFGEPILVS